MKKLKKIIAFLLASCMLFSSNAFAESDVELISGAADEESESTDETTAAPAPAASNFTLPQNQRAAIIVPGEDYLAGEDESAEKAEEELDALLSSLYEIGLNSVYIYTVNDERAYFNTDMNSTGETDYTEIAIEKAQQYNFRTYVVLDLDYFISECENSDDFIDDLISNTHRFALKYKCDGIVIDNYYTERNAESYGEYMRGGSGMGYENWLYDSNECYFSAVSEVIRLTDNSIPIGIAINDMWANASSNEEGSATEDPVQALYDGYSDTKKYIESGYADFCLVFAYGSITGETLPFEAVTSWWGDLAENNGLSMYVVHFNEKQGSGETGWEVDQILRQLTLLKETVGFSGSVFHSCSALLADTELAENIKKFYGDDINESSLFEELRMQSPSQLSFTTYEPYADFQGTFDENFEVLFNGQQVVLNSAGYFYFEEPLDIGMNTFTIEHKGTVYTYRIERKIITIRSLDSSIENGKSLTVTGGTKLEISCVAYKGASVTATLNGKTITLKQSESQQDDNINSSYAVYVGTYTVPDGIISQEQNLGTITVTSSYAGYTQSLYGASVKVMALPEPPKDITVEIDDDQNSLGSGEIVGKIDPIHTEDETLQYVKVSSDYTTVYNGSTAGSIATPDYAQLPAGTLDYLLASSGDYYITESNKRFNKNSVSVFSDTGLGKNALSVKSTGTSGGSSYFKIGLDYKISYNIEFVGNSYYSGGDGDFNLNDFTATQVYITFDNVTSVTKLPDFEYNYVFSGGKWEVVTIDGIPKFRLVLTLRQKGVYAGCGATYDSDGNLILSFGITTNSLSGMTIVIDPGHGYCKYENVLDPGAVGFITEYDSNLAIAKELESQLKAAGANVIRIKTESEFVLTAQRPAYGRNYGCDLFISIHANKTVGDSSVRGTEVYYFTPYSQPLAAAISSEISSYFSKNVYSDGALKNRGAKYSYYWVTLQQDFPSVLVETGFVSNYEDAMALADSTHQKNIAARIVSGIQTYINRSGLSYSSNGSVSADNIEEETEQTEETTVSQTQETTEPQTASGTSATTVPDVSESEETSKASDTTEASIASETEVSSEPETTLRTELSEDEFAQSESTPLQFE